MALSSLGLVMSTYAIESYTAVWLPCEDLRNGESSSVNVCSVVCAYLVLYGRLPPRRPRPSLLTIGTARDSNFRNAPAVIATTGYNMAKCVLLSISEADPISPGQAAGQDRVMGEGLICARKWIRRSCSSHFRTTTRHTAIVRR